jgi:hypothetical protein
VILSRLFQPFRKQEITPLRRIAMVGAIPGEYGRFKLSYSDDALLHSILPFMGEAGIPFAPEEDLQIDIVNIQHEYGGRDFLRESECYDVVLICNIYNPEDDEISPCFSERCIKISPYHFEPGVWQRRALASGAKIVIVNDNSTTLGPAVFLGTGELHRINWSLIPVLMTPDFLKAIAGRTCARHALGRGVRGAAAGLDAQTSPAPALPEYTP